MANALGILLNQEHLNDDIITNLLSWRHSGFNIDNSMRIAADNQEGKITLAQYIIRNTFSLDKLIYNEKTGTVIYHSKMTHGSGKKNFEIYTAEEFIAAVTQHIPEKSFQRIRYYGLCKALHNPYYAELKIRLISARKKPLCAIKRIFHY
ncbi:MAG: transposase [bacterium]